ncbi:MAG: leucine-rich repeat domain-containing protein [Chitinophagales bacterium]
MSITLNNIAKQRIQTCRKNRLPYLDLSGCNLNEIPEEVYEMDWIEVLDLSSIYYFEKIIGNIFQKKIITSIQLKEIDFDIVKKWITSIYEWYHNFSHINIIHNVPPKNNSISVLDKRILNLSNLRVLILANNHIKEIPPFFSQFKQLEVLNLSNNELNEIPSFIVNLTSLVLLDLSSNLLTKGFLYIKNLKKLQFLNLSNNLFSQILQHIIPLDQLRFLDLSKNQINVIPESIIKLKKLQFLFLGRNLLEKIPLPIMQLTELRLLELPDNQLYEIPSQLMQLKKLQFLSLNNNQLSTVSHFITQLTELQSLLLANNELKKIPSHIANLEKLQLLDVSHNQLREIPPYLVKLKRLHYLSLTNNYLQKLTSHLADLKQLRVLTLAKNQLTEFSSNITKLSRLQIIDIYGNDIKEIPTHISNLSKIKSLNISKNKLHTIPIELTSLQQLQFLNLADNQIKQIPPQIVNLQKLEILSLDNNQLSEIPPYITRLKKLQILSFDKNQLSEIPQHLTQLKHLQYLSLIDNQLSEIPDYLAALKKLKTLEISDNKIKELKDWAVKIPSLIALYSKGNPIKNIPTEIFDKNSNVLEAIRDYFKSLEKGKKRLFEAKLLIVGEGGVGKTSLKYKLKDNDFRAKEGKIDSTEGIDVSKQFYKANWKGKKKTFTLNVWDFGGQEVYHATHQFFLTNRSLYLLVWDSRKDTRQAGFDYWLNIIRLLGGKSPVLIIKNVFDNRKIPIAESQWKDSFTNIKGFFTINCSLPKEESGIINLWNAIKEEIQTLDHIGEDWGQDRINIRQALEEKAKKHPFISLNDYLLICKNQGGITTEEALSISQYLHDLGVILHFQDDEYLIQTVILRPEWGTTALYKILDDIVVQQERGILHYKDLATRIWGKTDLSHSWQVEDYPQYKYSALLRLMHRFELCFPIEDTLGQQFIIPELLEADIPKNVNIKEFEPASSPNSILQFSFDYPVFMPKGIITRFMVHLYSYIENKSYWRKGVILHHNKYNVRALILQNDLKKQIHIRIIGNNKKAFLYIIRQQINTINQSFGKQLKVYETLPCTCKVCSNTSKPHFFDYEELTEYQKDNIPDIRCRKSRKLVLIQEILHHTEYQISNPLRNNRKYQISNPLRNNHNIDLVVDILTKGKKVSIPIPPPNILIIHHTKDESLLNKLSSQLNNFRNENQLRTWAVNNTSIQEEEKHTFNTNLQKVSIVLLLISQHLISSNTYSTHLQKKIVESYKQKSSWIIPIYLSPFDSTNFPFTNLKTLPNTPKRPKYTTLWENQEKVWTNITEEIKTTVREFS